VQSSLVTPLVGTRPLGVVFIDYFTECSASSADLDFIHTLACTWARAIEDGVAESAPNWPARGMVLPPDLESKPPARATSEALVAELMTRSPVLIDAWVPAHVAQRIAHAASVHHLLAVDRGEMRGVLCQCDLRSARPDTAVCDLMRVDFVHVTPHALAEAAARIMLERSVGCLPVLDSARRLVGIITRRDLRSAGVLPGEPGLDACAACGNTHDLQPPTSSDSPVFCSDCSSAPERDSALEALYYTLGGSE
jgi:CBS domain-containing protein